MKNIISVLDETMQKSLLQDLTNYLCMQKNQKEFCIYSDYCLEDESKPNKVASFTIAPTWTAFPEIQYLIEKSIPTDIKDRKFITEEIVDTLKNKNLFHISFIIKDTSGLIYRPTKSSQEVVIQGINELIEMIERWIANQPEGADKFRDQANRFISWRREMERKSPNLNLCKNIIIISLLAGYISYMLTKEAEARTVVWFSDRDKIIESYNSIAFDLYEIYHYGLCDNAGINGETTKIGLAIKDKDDSSNKLWFDPLIRLPDYMAGTLASWDLTSNLVQKDKHAELLQRVFADNSFCTIINIDLGKNGYKCSRQTVSLTEQTLGENHA
jgi:hypothetical protein